MLQDILSQQEQATNPNKTRLPKATTTATKLHTISTTRMAITHSRLSRRALRSTRTTTIMGMMLTGKLRIRPTRTQASLSSSRITTRINIMQVAVLVRLMQAKRLKLQGTIQLRTSTIQRHRQLINQHSSSKFSSRLHKFISHWRSLTLISQYSG